MRKYGIILILCLAVIALHAQKTFFPVKEGTVLTYKNYDRKGNETGTQKLTIKSVSRSANSISITYLSEVFDKKMKPEYHEEVTIHQEGDRIFLDMSNFVSKSAFQQEGEIPTTVTVEGNSLEVPVNAKEGETLPDGHLKITSAVGFMTMSITADIINRKVDKWEDVTVKAGTFNCLKTTSDINMKTLGVTFNGSGIQWYAEGVGMVKTQSFDKKGELSGSSELVEIK